MSKRRRINKTVAIVGLAAGGAISGFGAAATAQEATGVACSDSAEAVAVDWRERTLVAGTSADNRIIEWEGGHAHFGDFALARLLPDGTVDSAFGDHGSLIVDVGDFDSLSAVLPLFGGSLTAGTTSQREGDRSGKRDLVVLRVSDAGGLVSSFGEGGIARFDLGGSVTVASLSHGWGGRAYVAGTIAHGDDPTSGFVLRLNAKGTRDASFGTDGLLHFALEGESVRFHGVRALLDGVVVGGHASREGKVDALALRFDDHGKPVSEYASSGIARYSFTGSAANDGTAVASKLGAAAISLSITSDDGTAQIATVRFDRDGQLVPSAEGDVSTLDIPGDTQDSVYAAALRGRSIVLAGGTSPDDFATGDAYVAQLTPDGALDPAFGDGVQTLHLDLEYTSFLGAVIRHGALTVAGYDFGEEPETLPPSDALVVRYLSDGKPDQSFGDGGIVKVDYRQGAPVCGPRVDVNGGTGHDHDHEGEEHDHEH
jgi:uncharacterized delta-60 repeat protein